MGWRLVVAGLLALLCSAAAAQSVESVLKPGELIRGHAKWDDDCGACHVRFDRSAQNERCMDCHKDIGADVRQRSGFHGRLRPQPCRSCHTDHKGRNARIVDLDPKRFDHAATDYALKGRHRQTDCAACHPAGRKYSQAPHDCLACHRKDDTHKGAAGPQCADCHGEADWKTTTFDHARTRFALAGRHAEAKCTGCHKQPSYKDTPRQCLACHRKDDDSAKGHRGRFGEKCESCHGARAWKPSTFQHDTETRFALRGKHRGATCTACHTGTLYRDKTASACADCHRKDDKHEGSLGNDCQACHGERDWKETGRFDHDRTRFALLDKHRDTRCEACHRGNRFKDTPGDCIGCHRDDDTHKGTLGTRCESCHTERHWKDIPRFDHDRSRFRLIGRHREVRCAECHKDTRYRETARDCIGCHRKDDKHEASLGTACESCHAEQDWKRATGFDHARTRFPLRDAHAARSVQCGDCHANPRSYRDTARECVACHRRHDKHEAQLGERCESCHGERSWKVARYDHARARFALLGRHLALECKACHTSLRYRDAARDCDGCHRKDDKHAQRLGTACESCHNARGWALWSFDHQRRTKYALDGAHLKAACEACHRAPAPRGQAIAAVGTTCIACHARDDRHDGGFGAQCERCHATSDWKRITQRIGGVVPAGGDLAHGLGAASWFARDAAAGARVARWPS